MTCYSALEARREAGKRTSEDEEMESEEEEDIGKQNVTVCPRSLVQFCIVCSIYKNGQ